MPETLIEGLEGHVTGASTRTMGARQPFIRLSIHAPYPLMRRGLRCLLEHSKDLLVIDETGQGTQAPCGAFTVPRDVAVIVFAGSLARDLEALRHLRASWPQVRLVLVVQSFERRALLEAMRLGVRAMLAGDCGPEELALAVREVHGGRRYIHPGAAAVLLDDLEHEHASGGRRPSGIEALSEREREVVEQLLLGRSTAAVAAALGIGHHTVDKHRRHAMGKLGVGSLAELVKFALRNGLASLDE